MQNTKAQIVAAIKDATLGALVAFILALPLVGFHITDSINGVEVETRFVWVAVAVIGVFAGRLLIRAIVYWRRVNTAPTAHPSKITTYFKSRQNIFIYGLIAIAFLLPFMPFTNRYIIDVATTVLIYIMLGWGLNIVIGLAGLLDLGYVAFYAVGAYSYALLALTFDLSFWICLPLAGLLAALFGVLLGFPVLRLRGDYLAIVTLGFGEIIRIVLLNWTSLTNGPNGITSIPRPSFFGLEFSSGATSTTPNSFHHFFGLEYASIHRVTFLYLLILLMALLTNYFVLRIRKLPIGRAWEALREDEIACRALGINPTNTKLTAFAIGAMFAGFAGSFFATRQGFISPESFSFIESATIVTIVVLGGMGSQIGVVVAAMALILLPELGREFAQFRMLLFGAAMVLIMAWRPRGLFSLREPTIKLNNHHAS